MGLMGYIYKNITGNAAVVVGTKLSHTEEYCNLSLANVHDSETISVDVYISRSEYTREPPTEDVGGTTKQFFDPEHLLDDTGRREDGSYNSTFATRTSTYYILKNCSIPPGVSLILSKNNLFYNHNKYTLSVKLGTVTSAVDVILNKKNKTGEELIEGTKLLRSSASSSSY